MAGPISCQFCSKLMDRFRRASGRPGPRDHVFMKLGELSDIIEMPCPHADSIRNVWERNMLAPYLGQMDEAFDRRSPGPQGWTVSTAVVRSRTMLRIYQLGKEHERRPMAEISLIFRPDEVAHIGTAKVLNCQWIDSLLPRAWYDKCEREHGQGCRWPGWMRLSSESTTVPQWLVDVFDNCVVESNPDTARYITLSYTWGGVQCLKHTSQTIEQLKKRGSLHPDQAPDIPRTVRDAIGITKLLGERYLWVDSLCIPQSEATTSRGLNSMHHIYANSTICLVALAGTDANHGLQGIQGVSAPRHVKQVIYDIAGGEKVSHIVESDQQTRDHRPDAIEGSTYNERGWTYQEYAFAKRRLIFTDKLLRWKCGCAQWGEELHGDTQLDDPKTFDGLSTSWMTSPGPDLALIAEAAHGFNTRYFTDEGDSLRAFLGIQNHISRDFFGGLNYGHPEMFFDISLLWREKLTSGIDFKRRLAENASSDPPSWSWMGWQGRFCFDRDEEFMPLGSRNDGHAIGFTQSIAQWYTMHSPLAPASDRRPVNCQWQTYRTAAEDGFAAVPIGWQKVTPRNNWWGSKQRYQRVQVYEGTGNNFAPSGHKFGKECRYLIPLPPYTVTTRSIEQRPFIFARTSRCFLTVKALPAEKSRLLPGLHTRSLGLFCHNGECAGLLWLQGAFCKFLGFELEVVAVVKGWTTTLSTHFTTFQQRENPVSPEWSAGNYDATWAKWGRRHNCYFVLCVKWENGVAKRQGTGIVEADIWERNQEPVDLILG